MRPSPEMIAELDTVPLKQYTQRFTLDRKFH